MNPDEISVYPNVRKLVTICKARIQILEIKIFESVRVAVYLINDKDAVVDATQYLIEGEEYAAWGNSDKYLTDLIRKKIQIQFNPTI